VIKIKKPVIYSFLKERLKSYSTNNHFIDLKKAKWVLGRYGIPKHLAYRILKDLEEYNLVKRVNQRSFRIKK
jgi:hypothetical protein